MSPQSPITAVVHLKDAEFKQGKRQKAKGKRQKAKGENIVTAGILAAAYMQVK